MSSGPWSPIHINKCRTTLISNCNRYRFPQQLCYSVSKPPSGRSVWLWVSVGFSLEVEKTQFCLMIVKVRKAASCGNGPSLHIKLWWSALSFPTSHPLHCGRPLPKALLCARTHLPIPGHESATCSTPPKQTTYFAQRAVLIALSWEARRGQSSLHDRRGGGGK